MFQCTYEEQKKKVKPVQSIVICEMIYIF